MHKMVTDPRILVSLLAISIALTMITNWLAAGCRRPSVPDHFSSSEIVAIGASVLWIMLLVFAGLVASRYVERIQNTVIGYLAYVVVAGVFSWIRAVLFHRLREQPARSAIAPENQTISSLVRIANYLLFSIIIYLFVAWILQRSAQLILLIPLGIGALLPDLDSPDSEIGCLLPWVSRWLAARFGQDQGWHSLAANALVLAVTAPLVLLIGTEAWALLSLGFLSHILLDLFTPQGVMLYWPWHRTRYSLSTKSAQDRNPSHSRKVLVALGILSSILLLAVEVGPPPPSPAPTPSYEQTLERYYSLRGSNLVYAQIDGSWQASGRRAGGTFEILNARGDSYIMLERYSGKVFTAGRNADDNLYLNRINLQVGPSSSIKAGEVHLQDQFLADALPMVYEIQQEAGLQHTYVSGDIVVAPASDSISASLQQDYAQTSLRRIQAHEPGHYSFHYLTASDLIALSELPVETANLLIIATYARPASGPTVTPLPTVSMGSARPAQ
jgi:membrane-bound metal-dependent hydrolase YbcI (DUF457 family)